MQPLRQAAHLVWTLTACLGFGWPAAGLASPQPSQATRPAATAIPAPDAAPFQPSFKPSLEVRRAPGPIFVDGDLGDAGWMHAARAAGFAEIQPGDQTRPPADTEAFVTYDDTNLYLGFLAHDDPQAVRASLRDRDEIFNDDWIGIILDTYGDAAWAYEIFLNPLGIPGDLRWTPQGEDVSFDLVFDSRGRITTDGYAVEVAIPFASLRFPERGEQTWRATFLRTHPRDSRRQYSWAALSRDDPCFPCQFGTLTGIRDVHRGTSLEVLPSVLATQLGTLRDWEQPALGLDNGKPDASLGLNVRYAFTSSLVADAALNPDFSQVEADAAQIDVNSTFALFYPERRPFFQEGRDLFDTYVPAVYTRSINDPAAAGKLTGRANRTSVGFITARDDHTPVILPFEERSEFLAAGHSFSNILRMKQTFLEDSFLGALVTDRRLAGGGSGSLVGADGSMRLAKNYRLRGQALWSHTAEPQDGTLTEDLVADLAAEDSTLLYFDGGAHSVAYDGEKYWGRALYAGLIRDARRLNIEATYQAASPTFRADNGFVTANSTRRASTWIGWTQRPANRWLDEIVPNANVARVWNFDGLRKDEWLRPELYMKFKKQTGLQFGYLWSNERFRQQDFNGIHRWDLNLWSDYLDWFKPGVEFVAGRSIARTIDVPVLGDSRNVSLWATLKPINRLVVRPSWDYARLRYHDTADDIFNGSIVRAHVAYQFTREMFLRVVVQYDSFDARLDVDPLFTYRVNPFTVFYVGSTLDYHDLDGVPDMTQTQRQFFMKFQYLLRV